MKRHAFDPVSFTFGLIFVALAAGLSQGLRLDPGVLRWIGAAVLLLVGVVMIVTSATTRDEDER